MSDPADPDVEQIKEATFNVGAGIMRTLVSSEVEERTEFAELVRIYLAAARSRADQMQLCVERDGR